jgi:hypothetical protein
MFPKIISISARMNKFRSPNHPITNYSPQSRVGIFLIKEGINIHMIIIFITEQDQKTGVFGFSDPVHNCRTCTTFLRTCTSMQTARNILCRDQVVLIFKHKSAGQVWSRNSKSNAAKLGEVFGVSPKTIRDIWVGRTWYRETFHLDPSRTDAHERLGRHVGRPKGAKDRRPRQRNNLKAVGYDAQASIHESGGQGENDVLTNHALREMPDSIAMTTCNNPTLPSSEQYGVMPDAGQLQILNSICQPKQTLAQLLDKVEDFAAGTIDLAPDILEWGIFSDPFHDDWAFWNPGELPDE